MSCCDRSAAPRRRRSKPRRAQDAGRERGRGAQLAESCDEQRAAETPTRRLRRPLPQRATPAPAAAERAPRARAQNRADVAAQCEASEVMRVVASPCRRSRSAPQSRRDEAAPTLAGSERDRRRAAKTSQRAPSRSGCTRELAGGRGHRHSRRVVDRAHRRSARHVSGVGIQQRDATEARDEQRRRSPIPKTGSRRFAGCAATARPPKRIASGCASARRIPTSRRRRGSRAQASPELRSPARCG